MTFPVHKEHLALIDSRLQSIVEPGEFKLMVGRSSVDWTACSLQVQQVEVTV